MADHQDRDFVLSTWYLNLRRIMELVKPPSLNRLGGSLAAEHLARSRLLGNVSQDVSDWLASSQISTLGELVFSGTELAPGVLVTHYDTYFCRGLSAHASSKQRGERAKALPELYVDLPETLSRRRVRVVYSPEDLTSASSWSMLTGRRQLFVLGLINSVDAETINVSPVVIATLVPSVLDDEGSFKASKWTNKMEISIDEVDSFELVRHERPLDRKASELEALRDIPETEVKTAIAEIVGEPHVPPDWAGEFSDLLTTRVLLGGERISAAFLFKGPAKFREMNLASLGKNGDQLVRLFDEPVDLVLLQHCHRIHRGVRDVMRTYATHPANAKLFCLIDGYDTLRLLRAYEKCGLSRTSTGMNPSGRL